MKGLGTASAEVPEMNCERHRDRPVIGYCAACGEFGCAQCLQELGGQLYCERDIKPLIAKLETRMANPEKAKSRYCLIVQLLNGTTQKGYCLYLNPEERGFHFEQVSGHSLDKQNNVYLLFEELKAVHFVRSLNRKAERAAADPPLWRPQGPELVVRFRDGVTIRGRALTTGRISPPHFAMVPDDTDTYGFGVLVEYAALDGVYTPEEYRTRFDEELRTFLLNHTHSGLSKEELTGDFCFAHSEYAEALEHYNNIRHLAPSSPRIRKKTIAAEYNLASQHSRDRDYEAALIRINRVLELDPQHEKAKATAILLHKAIRRQREKAAQSDPIIK